MMKLIDPLGIHTKPAFFNRAYVTGIVEIEFCYQNFSSLNTLLQQPYLFGQFFHEVFGAVVVNGVYSIEAKRIYVKFIEPHECVLNKIIAHAIAPGAIKIYSVAPRCFVFIGKVRTVVSQVIPFGPQVIVHHIEYYGNTPLVCLIHQLLKIIGRTIIFMYGKWKYAIIPPVMMTGALSYRHNFYSRNAQRL